jgi:NAD-dependent dihydropyrimidine dehydrogenase PreA subunit
VLVTGNYTLTVRRLRRALDGTDAWLLVADSQGVNVWCAAGGGHLTHHDVISVLRTSGIEDLVAHRRLMLPQLAATGVERRPIEEATGWTAHWGPARLEDLPAVLAHGGAVRGHDRQMRFPLRDRLEMASLWFTPMALVLGLLAWPIGGRASAIAVASLIVLVVAGRFATLPRIAGSSPPSWIGYLGLALVGGALGIGGLAIQGVLDLRGGLTVTAASIIAMAVLSIDLPGTTPLYPGAVNSRGGTPRISLDLDRCTGAADCADVCPCDVLELDARPRRAAIARPEACIACAACIVQCPEDALFFLMPDGRAVDAEIVRRTRLNLLGDRSVEVARAR